MWKSVRDVRSFCVIFVFCFFGLWADFTFKNKYVIVEHDTIIIHYLLRKEKKFSINEIDVKVRTKQTKYGNVSQYILSNKGRVLIKVDDFFNNSDLLVEKFKSIGKLYDGFETLFYMK